MMAAIPFPFHRSSIMSKKTAKATKTVKTTKPTVQVKKDAKGRFWLVPKDGGAEQGPFATKQEALDAKAGDGTAKTEKPAKAKKIKEPKEKKLSAIDAAAQVLAASKEPLNAKQMIEAMTAQNLWTSPGGKTPHATLYSAIIREIALKGKDARFVKTERGKFAAK
jgi:HB1, ASXL, restriction endonuclease HTH domain